MADPDDKTQREGVFPDGRPRRQPPIIDVEAVEVSPDGSRTTTAGSGPGASPSAPGRSLQRILTFLPPAKLAIIGSLGVVAAIIAGAVWIYLPTQDTDGPPRNAASPVAAAHNDTIERIGKPETVGDLESRMAALDATVASLGNRVAALESAVRDAAAAARVAADRADKAAGLLTVPPPPHAAEGREGGGEPNRAQQNDRAALEALAHRVTALELRQTALQQKQEGFDRLANAVTTPDKAIRIATVALALRSAVERNGPFTVELDASRSLGLDESALASLAPFAATGLPTRNELFHSLSMLVPELRRLSVPSAQDLGYFERLQASAVKMLNIRPVRDEPGDDPAAVMSRVEFKMPQQDIEAVVAELDKLPAPARDLAQGWRAQALARQQALESARLIAIASLAKLAEPAVRGPSPQ
jgi:hypothetical protein